MMKLDYILNGDIVMISDLNKPGMVVSCFEIFEAQPAFLLRVVDPDPATGGKFVTYCKRTIDKLEPLPDDQREEAKIMLYISPMEEVFTECCEEMERLECRYGMMAEAETVRDKSQRDAGYYTAIWRIKNLLNRISQKMTRKACAIEWYVARDGDGKLTLFEAKPDLQSVIPGHELWYRQGGFRTSLPKDFLPDLAKKQSCPVHVVIEMI